MSEASELAQAINGSALSKLYAVYAERFATLQEDGVPENWDGVFRPTSK